MAHITTRAVVVRVSMRETTYQEHHSLKYKVAIHIRAALRVHDIKRNIFTHDNITLLFSFFAHLVIHICRDKASLCCMDFLIDRVFFLFVFLF